MKKIAKKSKKILKMVFTNSFFYGKLWEKSKWGYRSRFCLTKRLSKSFSIPKNMKKSHLQGCSKEE